MRFLRPLILLAFLPTLTCAAQGQVQHFGMTPEQEFLLCAQQVLGKTVLWNRIFYTGEVGASSVPRVPCPASREEFIRRLQENAGILTLEDDGFAYLVAHRASTTGLESTPIYDGGTPPFKVDFDVSQGERSGRQLSEQELQTISRRI